MHMAYPDLSDPLWNTAIVQLLVETATTITRLDQRISASPVASSWLNRASWSGYAAALASQGHEIEEIDIFSRECNVPLPSRSPIATTSDPMAGLMAWQSRLHDGTRHHWSDGLTFPFEPPESWSERPALLRALELQARAARHAAKLDIWLHLPFLLKRLGVSHIVLPVLVAGDKALRLAPEDSGITRRYLRRLAAAAKDGIALLDAMEGDRMRFAAAIARSHRPGKLGQLAVMLMRYPATSPARAAAELDIGISGASKLLKRAAEQDLIVPIGDRHNWQVYLSPDLAVRFGFKQASRGRPPALPRSEPSLDTILSAFDAEMEAFDRRIGALAPSPQI